MCWRAAPEAPRPGVGNPHRHRASPRARRRRGGSASSRDEPESASRRAWPPSSWPWRRSASRCWWGETTGVDPGRARERCTRRGGRRRSDGRGERGGCRKPAAGRGHDRGAPGAGSRAQGATPGHDVSNAALRSARRTPRLNRLNPSRRRQNGRPSRARPPPPPRASRRKGRACATEPPNRRSSGSRERVGR